MVKCGLRCVYRRFSCVTLACTHTFLNNLRAQTYPFPHPNTSLSLSLSLHTHTLNAMQENAFGNLTCGLLRARYGADVALIPGGSFRSDRVYPPGPVTARVVSTIFPFMDTCVVIEVTGKQVRGCSIQRAHLRGWGSVCPSVCLVVSVCLCVCRWTALARTYER